MAAVSSEQTLMVSLQKESHWAQDPEDLGYHSSSTNYDSECQLSQRHLKYDMCILTLAQALPMYACNEFDIWNSALRMKSRQPAKKKKIWNSCMGTNLLAK